MFDVSVRREARDARREREEEEEEEIDRRSVRSIGTVRYGTLVRYGRVPAFTHSRVHAFTRSRVVVPSASWRAFDRSID